MSLKRNFYLMESDREAERLASKTDRQSSLRQLLDAGLDELGAHCSIADAGCGVGIVADEISEYSERHKKQFKITLIDKSEARLDSARNLLAKRKVEKNFINSDLTEIPIPDNSFDFVYSRFVFEYLPNQIAAFKELVRMTKKGGKILLGDLDYNCLTHYPIEPKLEKNLREAIDALSGLEVFDPYCGRKLYSYMSQAGLQDIKVRVEAHHLYFGELSLRDELNWSEKLRRLIELQGEGKVVLNFDAKQFQKDFMKALKNPIRFTYTPLILVEGRK